MNLRQQSRPAGTTANVSSWHYRPYALEYGCAIVAVGVAAILSWLLRSFLHPTPLLLFWGAVMLATWYGSLGAGLLAIVLSTLSVNLLFADDLSMLSGVPASTARLGLFVVLAMGTAGLYERRRRKEVRVRQTYLAQLKYHSYLLESVSDAIIATDLEFRVVSWNSAAERLYGWRADEAQGRISSELVQTEHVGEQREAVIQRLVDSGAWQGEVVQRRCDGTPLYVFASAKMLLDNRGTPCGVVTVNRDITEHKQHEQAVTQANEQVQHLLETISDGFIAVNDQLVMTAFNRAAEQLLGRSRTETLGHPVFEIFPEAKGSVFETQYHTVVQEQKPAMFETYFDQAPYRNWYEVRIYPQTFGAAAFFRVITDQKQAEQAQRTNEAQIRQQLAEIEAIYNNAPIGLGVLDTDLRFRRINERLAEMNGTPAAEHIGRTVREIVPKLADEVEPLFYQVIQTGEPLLNVELSGETKAQPGVQRAWAEHWLPLKNENDVVSGINIVVEEVTERKHLEAAQTEQRRLAETMRAVGLTLTSTLELPEVLNRILFCIEDIVLYDTINIMLLEAGTVSLVGSRGYTTANLEAELEQLQQCQLVDFPLLQAIATSAQPITIADITTDRQWKRISPDDKRRAYVGIPIQLRGEVIGFLNLTSLTPGYFTPAHVRALQAIAEQAAVAVANAQLHTKAKAFAALQERERLARELHDAVSQSLFSASLIAQALLRQSDKLNIRQDHLEQVHRLIQGAQAEMRMLLLELRPTALLEGELPKLISQLVTASQCRKQLEWTVDIDTTINPPAEVKLAFYRIAQEALNNIGKHAMATQATMALAQLDGTVELRISDNGKGFEPAAIAGTSMGLKIMQERANSVKAQLLISTQAGQGTTVRLQWPAEHEERNCPE